MKSTFLSEALVLTGSMGLILGAVDPVQGIFFVVPGSGVMTLGAYMGGQARRKRLLLGFLLLLAGALGAFWLSLEGGVGGVSGRSLWWLLLVLPVPVGWILSLLGTLGTGLYRKLLYFAFLLMALGIVLIVFAFSAGLFELDGAMSMRTVFLALLLPYLLGLLLCLALALLRFYRNVRRQPAGGQS